MNNFHMREGKVEFRWKRWRNKKRQEVSSCLMVLFSGMVLLGAGGVALAGPTGGQVTGGTGTINQTGTTTNVDQTSNVLNINWQDFSIGANETVNFNQPGADALAINRVVGGVPSFLAGALNANGRVFILNSAGITFTGTSHVNVGALLATTAMTVNGDPTKSASYSGTGYGSVINQGTIEISNGGFAILAAPYVQNTGFVKADLGTIALAGTNQFTLDLSGTGLINFVVPAGTVEQIVNDGKALGVDNSGTLQARSGQVIISANVASQVVNAVVNLNGVVDADAFAPNGTGGSVLVTGAGDVNVGGQVTARGSGAGAGGQIVTKAGGADDIEALAFVSAAGGAAGGKGGFVEVSAPNVAIEGDVRAGAGGSMLIDPASINIITNSPLGPIGGNVGELWLESHLQAGSAETFVASIGNVTVQALQGGALAGGSGNLTLTAQQNIIFKGVNDTIVTGGGNVSLTAVTGSIGGAGGGGHAFNIVSGGPGVSQAGDIVLNAGKNIFVNKVTVKSAGNSSFHALFSANAGSSFNAAGLIDVEAHASGAGGQTADADIHINAGNQITLHGITDLATAFKNGGVGHNVFADASVTLNGTQVHDTGAMTVAANVGGHAANSFVANADLEITNANTVTVAGGAIDVSAKAAVFSASNVFAGATAHIDPAGPVTLDSVFVDANVQADVVARACAIASFSAIGSKISIAHDAIVNATANNANQGRTASASANLFLTATLANASVGGNVQVTALALNGGGSQDADAFANLGIHACGAVVVDGDVTVIANAQTLQVASGDSSTPNASATANIDAFAGGIHLHGNVDVEAVASSLNSDSVTAVARARLNAFNGLGSSAASIQVDGTTKVLATAKTNAQNVFTGTHAPRGALASASLFVHAEGQVSMGAITVKASASDLGRFQANAIAHANIISVRDSISISGNVDVEANAQDPAGNDASANAEANIQASGDIDILGNVQVNATAQQISGDGAFACANLQIVASSHGEGSADVNVNGNVGVHALAETNGSGAASANAEAELSAAGGSGGDVTVNGSIDLTATANQLSNSGEGAFACANLDIAADSHFSSPAVINVNGAITVDAFARSNGASNVTANAQAQIGGHGTDTADGASFNSFGTAVDVTVHGDIDVSATANHVGTGSGAALALANLDIDGSAANVNVNGNIGVHANAQTNGTGASVFNAFGSSASRFYGAAAVARAEIAGEIGSSQISPASAGNVTVNGNVEVSATANQLNLGAGGGALACASLDMDASFDFAAINVHGDVSVNAEAKDLGTGSARANAYAGLDAEGSVLVHGNVNVDASANQLNGGGNSARACANLHMSASGSFFGPDVNVNGDVGVSAVALADGRSSAQANAVADIFAGGSIDITGNVKVDASASQNGVNGSFARANANLRLEADSGDVNVNGDVTASANAVSHGSESAIANANVHIRATSADVIVNGIVTANAHAAASSDSNANGARANASMSIVGDPVTLGGIVDHATATSHGTGFANALANVHVTGADVEIDGSVSVVAKALTTKFFAAGAQANANVFIDASGGGTGSQLKITGGVDVLASAHDSSIVFLGHANAVANVELLGNGNGTDAVDLGDVTVTANAFDRFAAGQTLANAQLLIQANNTAIGGVHMGSLDVAASAQQIAGTTGAKANALANAVINAHNTASATGHNVLVVANAFDGSSANANANLTITAGHIVLGQDTGSEASEFGGPIGARANAVANDPNAQAHALANVHITAATGNASIFGTLEGIASASFNFHGGNALNNITAIGTVHVDASANIVVEEIRVSALALNFGNKTAQAQAGLTLNAHNSISLEDKQIVSATAHNFGSNAAPGAGTTINMANAQAHFNGTQIHAPDSSQSIDVRAHAINAGHKAARAHASVSFGAASSVSLGGITLDVLSSDLRTSDNGAGAKASAILSHSSINTLHLTIGDHGVNIQAVANSFGTAKASARASLHLDQNSLSVGGPVTVNAQAFAGSHAKKGAFAVTAVELDATTGSLDVGNVTAIASAHNGGNNSHASAVACGTIAANGSGTDALVAGNITFKANAQDENGKGLTLSNAVLSVSADHGGLDVGSVLVTATANEAAGTTNAHAQAIANALLNAADTVEADGQFVLVVANAFDGSSAKATASLNVSGNHVLLGNSTLDSPDASIGAKSKAVANGNPGRAQAFTNVKITATSGDVTIYDNLVGIASASYLTNGGNTIANVVATADVEVSASSGSIFMEGMKVKANAQNFGDNSARAQANADLHANLTSGVVKFNDSDSVFVSATADNHNGLANASVVSGNAAFANAQLDIDANQINATSVAIDVKAHALNNGFAGVAAIANLDMGEAGSVNVNGITVDVLAHNLTTHGGKPGAVANATFNESPGQHLTVGFGGINVQADASSQGHAKASAHALVNIVQNFISIDGPVTVNAQAVGGPLVNSGVVAVASLFLDATTGNVNVQGPIFVKANAQNLGDGLAHGNAVADIDASGNISINGDVDVAATANQLDSDGNNAIACASLELDASTGGSVNVNGGIGVYAKAQASGATFASANAQASIANASNITINGNVDVTASANVTNAAGTEALACANLRMDIIGESSLASINVNGHINVDAFAQSKGHDDVTANAKAEVEAEGSSGEFGGNVTVNGNIDVTATANHAGSGTGRASACANLDVDASSGNVNINGSIGAFANAQSVGDGFARAQANAEIGAENDDNLNGSNAGHVWVNGSIEVKAAANQLDSDGGNAFACANLDVVANSGSINVNGNITVEGLAQVSGSGARATANADAELEASTAVTVNGLVSANAQALSLNSHGSGASARATVDVDAFAGGNITLGGVADKAFASSQGVNGANALAGVDIGTALDEGTGSGPTFVNHINIAGNVIVNATAVGGSHVVHNVVAIADLQIDEARSINIGGTLGIHANAQDNGTTLSGAGLAHATGVLEALDSVTISGQVSVTADLRSAARGSGTVSNVTVADELVDDGLELNLAIAKLHIGSFNDSTGVNIKLGGVAVTANLDLTNSNFGGKGQAIAGLVIEADTAGSVLINGNLLVLANGQAKGNSGSLEVSATADISAHSGVTINGNATVKATASALGTATGFNASASAELTLETPSGNIAVGFVDVEAQAAYSGSKSGDANALAEAGITAGGGHAFLKGANVFADADIPNSAGGSANGTAVANLTINASSNINVGTAGIFVQADAFAPSGGHAFANALSRLDAGTGGVGGIFIQGNDIGLARAIGGGGTNTALANVHLAAGGASEFGTGAPSNFGNVVVFGNIEAHAAADSLHDHANASVEIFAHNNIFIIGEDPIASARLGPNGSLIAFRQAHFSTNQSVTGTQGTATADIDIRAGEHVIVIPLSSLTHIDKLFALPTDTPTLNSGSLTIIPLTIEGGDCGVLGPAGATEDAIKKAKECHKSPINVSDLTDVSP